MPQFTSLPSLKQLRHLIAVADHRHFGRAAAACFLTQSSLSASIKEMETLLGKVLIERTRRTVMPTPLGLEVVARARAIVQEVEDIVTLIAAAGAPLSGSLRLGVIPTIAPFLLPRVLPALRKAYPDLDLYLREDTSARLIDGLADGSLDLLLLAFPYPADGLQTHLFAEDPFWVAFPKGHAHAGKERLIGADLRGETVLLLAEGHCLRDHAARACGLAGNIPAGTFQGSSLHTLAQMADNGLGLTLLPKMAIDAGIAKGTRLQMRPLEGRGRSRDIGFAWRQSSPRADEFTLLATFFRDELATPLRQTSRANAGRLKI